jgi:hypothetical protein
LALIHSVVTARVTCHDCRDREWQRLKGGASAFPAIKKQRELRDLRGFGAQSLSNDAAFKNCTFPENAVRTLPLGRNFCENGVSDFDVRYIECAQQGRLDGHSIAGERFTAMSNGEYNEEVGKAALHT